MIVLVDCDNFFASCERVMQPRLIDKPVAVLSNNDGCVIARSGEVKQAGVTMGQPYHECKALLDSIGAEVFSANFLLYRHFAKRIQGILRAIPARSIEVYSIDESFIDMGDRAVEDWHEWALLLKNTIHEWTGIPVSVGVGSSRALAKLATRVAKKNNSGAYVFGDEQGQQSIAVLQATPIEAVWGIGRRLGPKLRLCGIQNAYDFSMIKPDSPTLKLLDWPMKDLIYQMRGWSSGQVERPTHQTSMMYSRSFGVAISRVDALRAVFAEFCEELARKLRHKGLVAECAIISVRYRDDNRRQGQSKSIKVSFGAWTNDTTVIVTAVDKRVSKLFTADTAHSKAMVVLPVLRAQKQMSINDSAQVIAKQGSLMDAIDTLETRYGAAGPRLGLSKLDDSWRGKRQFISPYNHANWHGLPRVNTK